MNNSAIESQKKYNKWVVLLSIAIPIVIAILFKVRLDFELPVFLPPIYATINAITAVVLVWAVIQIRRGKRNAHEWLMKTAILMSLLFLVLYILYHMTSDSTPYEGNYRAIYYVILISHIVLSVMVIPFVLITYVRAITNDFKRHKKIAKITFPLWLYVAVSGVTVYLMISPYYKF